MSHSCYLCQSLSSVAPCDCPSSPVTLCPSCLSSYHSAAHLTDINCTNCEQPPVKMCLACWTYLCVRCLDTKHMEICSDSDLYPIDLHDLTADESGLVRLRRGKSIQASIEYIKTLIEPLRHRLVCEVETAIETAHCAIETAKISAYGKVNSAIDQLSSQIASMESHLLPTRFDLACVPTTHIENLLLHSPQSDVLSSLSSEIWFEVVASNGLLSELEREFVRVQNASVLFSGMDVACPWANRYFIMMGKNIQFCDLEKMAVEESSVVIPDYKHVSCIQLPSGEYFLCGGLSSPCLLLDNNYSSVSRVGSLAAPRNNPGLALYLQTVYIFGGKTTNDRDMTKTIQAYSVEKSATKVLHCELSLERSHVFPCVFDSHIYICGGHCRSGCESFTPSTESIEFLPFKLPFDASSVLLPYENSEIMVFSYYQFSINLKDETVISFTNEEVRYETRVSPVLYKGKYYFTTYWEKEGMFRLVCWEKGGVFLESTEVEFRD